jgi:hypothetical protein
MVMPLLLYLALPLKEKNNFCQSRISIFLCSVNGNVDYQKMTKMVCFNFLKIGGDPLDSLASGLMAVSSPLWVQGVSLIKEINQCPQKNQNL